MVLLYFVSIFLSGIFYKPRDTDEDDEEDVYKRQGSNNRRRSIDALSGASGSKDHFRLSGREHHAGIRCLIRCV